MEQQQQQPVEICLQEAPDELEQRENFGSLDGPKFRPAGLDAERADESYDYDDHDADQERQRQRQLQLQRDNDETDEQLDRGDAFARLARCAARRRRLLAAAANCRPAEQHQHCCLGMGHHQSFCCDSMARQQQQQQQQGRTWTGTYLACGCPVVAAADDDDDEPPSGQPVCGECVAEHPGDLASLDCGNSAGQDCCLDETSTSQQRPRMSSMFVASPYSRAHRDSFAMLRALSQKKSKSAEDVAYLSSLVLQIWAQRDRNPLLQSVSSQQLASADAQHQRSQRATQTKRPKSSLAVHHSGYDLA